VLADETLGFPDIHIRDFDENIGTIEEIPNQRPGDKACA
jgi:hypothetical protein